MRGRLARKRRKAMRVELSLGERVHELADRYIAKGSLWEFLKAVNRDYEHHARELEEARILEDENAATFISEVLARREVAEQEAWERWEDAKHTLRAPLPAGTKAVG